MVQDDHRNTTTKAGTTTTVLVTGGAGYVGSHCTLLLLLEQNYNVVVMDNCCKTISATNQTTASFEMDSNGNYFQEPLQEMPESLRRVEQLAGRKLEAFYGLDLVEDGSSSDGKLDELFHRHNIDLVMHFAALKSIPESLGMPLEYYTNNLSGTINLLNVMRRHGCRNLIFSSSATVYGLPQYLPVDEKHQVGLNILNPYGRSKCMIEDILKDLCIGSSSLSSSSPSSSSSSSSNTKVNGSSQSASAAAAAAELVVTSAWNIISLRYFNPVGAHPSGLLGEHSHGCPNNLMPYVAQVAARKREKLFVFGDDFDTKDGTGVRDYIHIMDLAQGHKHALKKLQQQQQHHQTENTAGYRVYNLGTGRGYSVLEVIRTYEQVNGVTIPHEITSRRQGDAGEVYADANLARDELGWEAKHSLIDMCRDTYNWQTKNPDGFKSPMKNCTPINSHGDNQQQQQQQQSDNELRI